MKSSKAIVSAVAAAIGLAAVAPAFAQGYDRRGPDQRFEQRGPDNRQFDRRDDRRDFRGDNDRRDFRRGYYNARGPEFQRGHRIPTEFRNRQYVVNDWRAHRLSAPPRGQQWVQVGSDYALIAIATGVIASLVLNSN